MIYRFTEIAYFLHFKDVENLNLKFILYFKEL